jgi:hypothetical protein
MEVQLETGHFYLEEQSQQIQESLIIYPVISPRR